jgi:hypothetical protein
MKAIIVLTIPYVRFGSEVASQSVPGLSVCYRPEADTQTLKPNVGFEASHGRVLEEWCWPVAVENDFGATKGLARHTSFWNDIGNFS